MTLEPWRRWLGSSADRPLKAESAANGRSPEAVIRNQLLPTLGNLPASAIRWPIEIVAALAQYPQSRRLPLQFLESWVDPLFVLGTC
jgi:hypothetical protein